MHVSELDVLEPNECGESTSESTSESTNDKPSNADPYQGARVKVPVCSADYFLRHACAFDRALDSLELALKAADTDLKIRLESEATYLIGEMSQDEIKAACVRQVHRGSTRAISWFLDIRRDLASTKMAIIACTAGHRHTASILLRVLEGESPNKICRQDATIDLFADVFAHNAW